MNASPIFPPAADVRRALARWFQRNARPLPWRADYSPYAVWISEMLLQQTQMERGVAYFQRWMARFPDVASVAAASEEEVLRLWEGLGYYARARNLHRAARQIMAQHGGVFPADPDALRRLPGVGPYTAGAIASIAFNRPVPCVDANVERILARVYDIDSPVRLRPAARRIGELAQALVPPDDARRHNQALMELGALVCRKRPCCEQCPLRDLCQSRHLGIVAERPVPGGATPVTPLLIVAGVLMRDGLVFVQKRLTTAGWPGLWEFPGGRVEPGETPDDAVVREFREETDFRVRVTRPLGIIRHGYTTFRVTLHCFALEPVDAPLPPPVLTAASACRWARPDDLRALAMPAAHRKLADQLWGREEARQEAGTPPAPAL